MQATNLTVRKRFANFLANLLLSDRQAGTVYEPPEVTPSMGSGRSGWLMDRASFAASAIKLNWVMVVGQYGLVCTWRGISTRLLGEEPAKYIGRTYRHLKNSSKGTGSLTAIAYIHRTVWHMIPRHGYQPYEPNYCHWLLETLPLLTESFGPNDGVIVNAHPKAWQIDSLEAMGVARNRIYVADAHVILCRSLVQGPFKSAGSRSGESNGETRRAVMRKLKERLGVTSEEPRRKVFLSRQDLCDRYITNFEEVEVLLQAFNVEIYIAGSRPWVDEVALFDSCELIIGCHGAALANAALCQSGSKLIEITGGDQADKTFYEKMAKEFRLTYQKYQARLDLHSQGTNGWVVNIRDLRSLLMIGLQQSHVE